MRPRTRLGLRLLFLTIQPIFIFFLFSCKKELDPPVIQFILPSANEQFNPGAIIPFEVHIYDADGLTSKSMYLIDPKLDTDPMEYSTSGDSHHSIITATFIHGIDHSRLGKYSFTVVAKNNEKETHGSRAFIVGDDDGSTTVLGILEVEKSSPYESYLRNTELSVINEFNGPDLNNSNYAGYSNLLLHYTTTGSTIEKMNGFTGEDLGTLMNKQAGYEPQFYSRDYLYVYQSSALNEMPVFKSNGELARIIALKFGQAIQVYEAYDIVHTCEKNGQSTQLVNYHKSTGAKISSFPVPNNLEIKGFYDLGNPNRIYFVTDHPINAGHSALWYYNKMDNAIAQTTYDFFGSPLSLNPIIDATQPGISRAIIFTDAGSYEHYEGRIPDKINLGIAADESKLTSYDLNYENNYVLLRDANYECVYDIKAKGQVSFRESALSGLILVEI